MSRKNLAALGCAALVGAALAFHAGVIFGGRNAIRQNGGSEARSDNAPPKSHLRNVYSPEINNDPYVQDHWHKLLRRWRRNAARRVNTAPKQRPPVVG